MVEKLDQHGRLTDFLVKGVGLVTADLKTSIRYNKFVKQFLSGEFDEALAVNTEMGGKLLIEPRFIIAMANNSSNVKGRRNSNEKFVITAYFSSYKFSFTVVGYNRALTCFKELSSKVGSTTSVNRDVIELNQEENKKCYILLSDNLVGVNMEETKLPNNKKTKSAYC